MVTRDGPCVARWLVHAPATRDRWCVPTARPVRHGSTNAAASYKDVLQQLSEGIDQGSSLDLAQATSHMDDVRSSVTDARRYTEY
jgi:hypothetical protein